MLRRLLAAMVPIVLGCGGKAVPPGAPPIAADRPDAGPVEATSPAPALMTSAEAQARLAELAHRAIGDATTPPTPPDSGDDAVRTEIAAFGPCTRPTDAERTALRARIAAWSTRPARGLRASGELGDLAFGCLDRGAIIVDAARVFAKGSVGVWWVLRVDPKTITVVDEIQGDPPEHWGEWAQENTVSTVALVDLDGDGTLDPVRERVRHEGGAVSVDLQLATGNAPGVVVGGVDGALDLEATQPPPSEHTLLVRATRRQTGDPPPVWQVRCVTTASTWTACPLAAAAQQRIAREAAAELAINESDTLLADPGLLDEQLAVLGVPAPDRAPLLAYATASASAFVTAIARINRALTAERAARTNSEQAAVDAREAAALGGALRTAIGEPACPAPTAAQAAAATAAVTRWLRAHERSPRGISVAAQCAQGDAGYATASWARETVDNAGTLSAGLFYVKGARVALVADVRADDDGPGAEATLTAKFALTGTAQVALVETDKLIAVVDGVVTGTHALPPALADEGRSALGWIAGASDGDVAMTEDSLARTIEGDTATFWHATPAGVVVAAAIADVDIRAPMTASDPLGSMLETSERRLAARDLLAQALTERPIPDVRENLVAAAKLLGAPQALIDAAAAAAN